MRRTAWTGKASSLPSDRIPPATKQKPPSAPKGKQADPPLKSTKVKKLEILKDSFDLQESGQDPDGGCFCLARVHELSPHTPICRECGLILCNLNRPHFACPHCATPLLTDAQRERLVESLEKQIAEALAMEERERQQVEEEARRLAGAFPTLRVSQSRAAQPDKNQPAPAGQQTHKVISINSKTGEVKVESRKPVPTASAMSIPNDAAEKLLVEGPPRVPAPPPEVVIPRDPPKDRLWARMDDTDVLYLPPPKLDTPAKPATGKGSQRRKQQGAGVGGSGSGANSADV